MSEGNIKETTLTSSWLPFDSELIDEGWGIFAMDIFDPVKVMTDDGKEVLTWEPNKVALVGVKFVENKIVAQTTRLDCLPNDEFTFNIIGKTGSQILKWYNEASEKLAESIRKGNYYLLKGENENEETPDGGRGNETH